MSAHPDTLDLLSWMMRHGSFVSVSWGEDTGWEAAWVTGGNRYCGAGPSSQAALYALHEQAREATGAPVPDWYNL